MFGGIIRSVMSPFSSVLGGGGSKEDGGSGTSINPKQVRQFLDEGQKRGEQAVGGTIQELGKGRANIRSMLEDAVSGKSASISRMRNLQQSQQRDLKAKQLLQGGGSQMNDAAKQQMQRQQGMDLATQQAQEQARNVSMLSREYGGQVGDILKSSGQWGSVLVGAQKPAMPAQPKQGFISNFLSSWF
jgi:hypothetical protein